MSENEAAQDPRTDLPALTATAEAILSAAWGGPVRLDAPELLREKYRNKVARFTVTQAPPGAPRTIIAKAVEGSDEQPFDPANDTPDGPAWRFYNEWAGNLFLNSLDITPPLNPRLWGGSRDAGVFVLEDLGAPQSLADRMQGDDRPALQAALLAYAGSMGRLHAATIGKEGEFARIRQAVGGSEAAGTRRDGGARWLADSVPAFHAVCAALGVTPAPGFESEAEDVARVLDDPGPFLAFAPGDTCPDNHRLMDDGKLRFFDFEGSGFRHALLDAAYFFMPFPTCWCVNRLPDEMVDRMEAAYRNELAVRCPPAADDTVFAHALARACAYWAVTSVGWNAERALKEDGQWGISTLRQRHPLRLLNFAHVAERTGAGLPALAETCRALAAALRERWADVEEMPVYPPFRIR